MQWQSRCTGLHAEPGQDRLHHWACNTLENAEQQDLTLKEVGVPLTAMGRAAATDRDPATGNGAASPAATPYQDSLQWFPPFSRVLTRHALWQRHLLLPGRPHAAWTLKNVWMTNEESQGTGSDTVHKHGSNVVVNV